MKPAFIEVTIITDTADTLVAPRKGLFRVDQITSVVDISSGKYRDHSVTEIHLIEEMDYVNDDSEDGGVVRARRAVVVQEDYATIGRLIDAATRG